MAPLSAPAPLGEPAYRSCGLSNRGLSSTTPALTYLDAFLAALGHQWSEADPGEDRYIVLCVAENKLSHDIVQQRLCAAGPPPGRAAGYDDMRGCERLRGALARYCSRTLMRGPVPVEPQHVCASAGCGSVLETLMFALCDPGHAVLVPAPYYAAFDNDLRVKAAVVPVAVQEPEGGLVPTASTLEGAYQRCEAEGVPVRAVLLTNPTNPTGLVYPRAAVEGVLRWAFQRGLHVVSDEIYGNSVFAAGPQDGLEEPFESALQVAEGVDPEAARKLLHVVFGFSKDFAVSGYRLGCVHTRNEGVLRAYSNLGYFCAVPGGLQHRLAEALDDEPWVDEFLSANRGLLRASYLELAAELGKAKIPFVPAVAGLFVWCDLRGWLKEPTFEEERRVFNLLLEEGRVVCTPGQDTHCAVPGYFRLCFSAVPPAALRVAVVRMRSVLDRVATGKL